MMRASRLIGLTLVLVSCSGGGGSDGPTNPGNPSNPSNPNPTTPTGPQGPFTVTAATSVVNTGPAGFTIPVPLKVTVANAAGPAAGVTVNWAGSGSIVSAPTSVTNASGEATISVTLGAVLGTQTVTASVASGTTTATFNAIVVATSLTVAPLPSLIVGDTVNVAVTGKDAQGTTLTGGTLTTFLSRTTGVATTPALGRVTAIADGTSWIVATLTSLNTTVRDSVQVNVYNRLRGRVFTYNDAPLPALRAYSTNSGKTDSVNVNADGTYTLTLTAHFTGNITDVTIDEVNKANRTYFPALLPIEPHCGTTPFCVNSSLTEEHRFLLVPRSYTVTRGTYAGRVLAVNLDSAMSTPNTTGPSYLGASGQFFAQVINGLPPNSTIWSFADQTWSPDSFPIPAAMHPTDGQAITAADSIAVWSVLNDIETTLGYDIWTPVNRNPAWNLATAVDQTTVPRRTLLFSFNASILSPGTSGAGGTGNRVVGNEGTLGLVNQHEVHVLGWRGTTIHKYGSGSIQPTWQNFMIRDNTQINNRGLIAHEAMHTLGVFHGCTFISVQSYCPYTPADAKPTFEDAAYLLLSMELKRAQIKKQAPYVWTPAMMGYRVFMRGLPPLFDALAIPLPAGLNPIGNGLREGISGDIVVGRKQPRR